MKKKQMKAEIEGLKKEVAYWIKEKNDYKNQLAQYKQKNQALARDLDLASERIAEQNRYWAEYSKKATKAIMDIRNCCELYNSGIAVLNRQLERKNDGEC